MPIPVSPMRKRDPTVSGAWLSVPQYSTTAAVEPEPEPEPQPQVEPRIQMQRRHDFLRVVCSRLASAVSVGTGGDPVDRMLSDRNNALPIQSFFTDPTSLRLYVWVPTKVEHGVMGTEAATFLEAFAAARHARDAGLAVSLDPPGVYRAAICLFKAPGVITTESNVTRTVSTIDLGGCATYSLAQTRGRQTGISATLAQVGALSRHLYFPVGAELLCPKKGAAPTEAEAADDACLAQKDTSSKPGAVSWSDGWSITAMDAEVGEGAKRQVTADFSRFIADMDVAAYCSMGSNEVCLPVPLSEAVMRPVEEEKSLSDRVRMIESAVGLWTSQCRSILEDELTYTAQSRASLALPGPRVELERWRVRQQRLESVTNQLNGPQVEVCIEVLRAVKSTVYAEFKRLCKEVSSARKIAASNCMFLQPLDPWLELLESSPYAEIRRLFRPIVHLLCLIRLHSPHYGGSTRMIWMLRCVTSELIKRSCGHFGKIESFGTPAGRWGRAKTSISGNVSEATRLDRANHRLTEILRACESFKSIIIDGCFAERQSSHVPEAWNDVRPAAICGRLDRFVDRCHALQRALVDAENLRVLPSIEITGAHRRPLSTALSLVGRDVSVALTRFLAKAGGAPETFLDMENATTCTMIDDFSKLVLEFDRRLEEFISQGVDLSNDLFECFEFIDCIGALGNRAAAGHSLTKKLPAIAHRLKSELQAVDTMFERGCADYRTSSGRGVGANMPPTAGTVVWAQCLSKRIEVARQTFDLLVDKFGAAGASAATEVETLCAASDRLAKQLQDWRKHRIEEWLQNLTVSPDDLKGPLLRRKDAAVTTSAGNQPHVQLQIVVNLPERVTVFAREIKCASIYLRASGEHVEVPPNLVPLGDAESSRQHAEILNTFVNEYNQILVTILSEECAVLERQHANVEALIKNCISSSGSKVPMNWRSHGIAAFITRMRSALRSLASGVEALHSNSELIRSTVVKWCNFPLFDRKTLDSPLHESLELNADETKLRVDNALSTLRILLADGLANIAKKLKMSANKVGVNTRSTKWQLYARYCAQKVQTGIRQAYVKTLTDLRDVVGEGHLQGGLQTTPIMEIKLELAAGIVHFTPHVFATSTAASTRGMVTAWAAATSEVYNGAFMSAAAGTAADALGATSDVARILIAIEQAETECAERRAEFLQPFIQLSSLWEDDMSTQFAKFMQESGEQSRRNAASCDRDYFPFLQKFEEQINHFRGLGNTVADLPSFATVNYIRVDARPIKQAMTSWVTKWSSMYEAFLIDSVNAQIKGTRQLLQSIEAEIDVDVDHDDTLLKLVRGILRVEELAQTIAAVFRPIQDTIEMLEGLGVPIGDDVVSLASRTETWWDQILRKCEGAKSRHERGIQALSKRVAEKSSKLVNNIKDWRRQFHRGSAPVNKFTLDHAGSAKSFSSVPDEQSHNVLYVGMAMYDHRERQFRAAYADLQKLADSVRDFQRQLEAMKKETSMFQLQPPKVDLLDACRSELLRLKKIWDVVSMVTMTLDHWSCANWADAQECTIARMINISKVLLTAAESASLDEWRGFASVTTWIKSFHAALQALEPLHQSRVMRRRHWRSLVKQVIKLGVSPSPAMRKYCEHDDGLANQIPLSLGDILSLQPQLLSCVTALNSLLSKAEGESKLDTKLSALSRYYEGVALTFNRQDSELDPMTTPPTLAQMYRLDKAEHIFTKLGEHQTDVSAMQCSKYLEFFRATVGVWSERLRTIATQLTLVAELGNEIEEMSQWYLVEPRARLDLENDTRMFELIFFRWQRIVIEMADEPNVMEACSLPERLESLKQIQEIAERCKVALEGWVECVRSDFPRLYFLSDDELLSATVRSTPMSSRQYLPKLYAGVRELHCDPLETEVVGVSTSNAYTLPLQHPVSCSQDRWLAALLHELQQMVHNLLADALMAKTESSHVQLPQVNILKADIVFTRNVEVAMQSLTDGNSVALHNLESERSDEMRSLVLKLRRGNNDTVISVASIKIQLLCELRHRDVLKTVSNASQDDLQEADWLWQSQPRYYHSAESDRGRVEQELVVKVMRAEFEYSYELLPISMFHQPLTDRAFVTMATIVNSGHGVSLCGPTGAGKTHSVVALGYSLGRMVYTLGCHGTMHPRTMACIFKGIAHAGVWCCFDYCSVAMSGTACVLLAQHLGCLISGIQARAETVGIGGDVIPLSILGAFFTTKIDAAAGVVTTPKELRSWLRPVSIHPMNQKIFCECILLAAGSGHSGTLGAQLALLFDLCSDCLSAPVYDWSIRAVSKVIDLCELEPGDISHEQQQIVRAFMTAILPRLYAEDRSLLCALVLDTFDHNTSKNRDHRSLLDSAGSEVEDAIACGVHEYCQLTQLQPSDDLLTTTCQLGALLRRSAAVVLVGNAGSGKSTAWKALAAASKATVEVLSPNSTSASLILHSDPDANGARHEGPLTKILRRMVLAAHRDKHPKWVVLDGSLDLRWMETIHEIADESNCLYIPSSNGTVLLDGSVQLLLECDSLANASPASISRAAVLSLRESEPSWRLAASSWLSKVQSEATQKRLQQIFDTYLECLTTKIEQRCPGDRAAALAAVSTACSLLSVLLLTPTMEQTDNVASSMNRLEFAPSAVDAQNAKSDIERVDAVFNFVAVWSFGGSIVLPAERRSFDVWWRSTWQGTAMPKAATVFDFYLTSQGNYVPWSSCVVPQTVEGTVDLRSYCIPNDISTSIFVLYELLRKHQRPLLLTGLHGAGKTCIVRNLSSAFPDQSFVYASCNHTSTSAKVMEAFLDPLTLKNGVLAPTYSTERGIIFVLDDITAPDPDAYGGQSVAAFLRHLCEYGQLNLKGDNIPVRGVQCVAVSSVEKAACRRIGRHFATLGLVSLSEAEMVSLFEPVVTREFASAGAKRTASTLVRATIALHCEMKAVLPSVAGSCITSVLHGLCRVQDFSTRSLVLVQLWLQECRRTYRDRLHSLEDLQVYDVASTQICKRYLDSSLNLQQAQQQILFVPAAVQSNRSKASPLVEMAADDVRKLVTSHINSSTSEQELDRAVDHHNTLVMEALEHICRAARSLSVPSGHLVVTGARGSGKYTSAALGARVCGYKRIIELTGATQGEDSFKNQDNFKNQLKEACVTAGCGHAVGYVCLLTGDVPDYAVDLIDSVVATGSVRGGFQTDATQILAAMQTELSQQGLVVGPQECWGHFQRKVQQNLHFIIVSCRPCTAWRRFPSLWRSSGINFVPSWSSETLLEMCRQLIQPDRLNLDAAHTEALVQSFVRGHLASVDACRALSSKQERYVPIAPDTLRDCVRLFENLVVQRRMDLGEDSQNIHVVLQNITRLETTVIAEMRAKLASAEHQEKEKNADVDDIIEKVGTETDRLKEQTKVVEDYRKLAEPVFAKVSDVKTSVDSLRDQVSAAESDLKGSAAELKKMKMQLAELAGPTRQKPDLINVVAAVVMLMNTSGTKPDTSWKYLKSVISEADFRHNFAKFDAQDVADSSLVAAQVYLKEPYFDPDYLRTKCNSQAAAVLCNWVKAVVAYCLGSRLLESRMDSLAAAEQAAAESVVKLKSLDLHIASLAERVDVLKKEFEICVGEKAAATELVRSLADRIATASKVVRCLSAPAKRWHVRDEVLNPPPLEITESDDVERARFERFDSDSTGMLEKAEIHAMMLEIGIECGPDYLNAVLAKFDIDDDGAVDFEEFKLMWKQIKTDSMSASTRQPETPDYAVGDAVVAAVHMTYLAAFGSVWDLREKLRNVWLAELDHHGLVFSKGKEWWTNLQPTVHPTDWVRRCLPADNLAIDNATVALYSHRIPLLIDPESQAEKWLAELYGVAGLRVVHCKDDDMLDQISVSDTTPLVIQMDDSMSANDTRELVRGLRLYCQRASLTGLEVTAHARLFLHYHTSNPSVPAAVAPLCTIVWFGSTPTSIKEQALSMIVTMSLSDVQDSSHPCMIKPALAVHDAQSCEEDKLKVLLQLALKVEPDNEYAFTTDNSAINKVITGAEEWLQAADVCRATTNRVRSAEMIRKSYEPLAQRMASIFSCCQQTGMFGDTPGDAAAFVDAVRKAISGCWKESTAVPTVESVSSDSVKFVLRWVRSQAKPLDYDLLVGMLCVQEANHSSRDLPTLLLSHQLQPNEFADSLSRLVCDHLGKEMADELKLTIAQAEVGVLKLAACFQDHLQRSLVHCESRLISAASPAVEEYILRCCWLHSVLTTRAHSRGTNAFHVELLDAVLDAAQDYTHELEHVAMTKVVSLIYTAGLVSEWDRRVCNAYVQEIMATESKDNDASKEGPCVMLPNLPLSGIAQHDLRVAMESGKEQAVASHYLEAITATCDLNSFHGLSQLLGVTDSELDVWMERTEQETLDRWWTINDVVPPQPTLEQRRATAKSTVDDLLDDLPPDCVDMQYAQAFSQAQDPMWSVVAAVQREALRYERTRSRAEAMLKDVDRALEAASRPGPPMHPQLEALVQALAVYTVPADWFCDQATESERLENEPESRQHVPALSTPFSSVSSGSGNVRSVHDWLGMMQTCLSQLMAWQAVLSQTTPANSSGTECSAHSNLLEVNLSAVFRPREFLAACRLAIARRHGWPLKQTSWKATVCQPHRTLANSDNMQQTATEAVHVTEGGCVTVVGLQLCGAAWTESGGLHFVADEGTGRGGTATKEMPPVRLTLVYGSDQEPDPDSEVCYECPVFKHGNRGDCMFTVKLRVDQSVGRWETLGVSMLC